MKGSKLSSLNELKNSMEMNLEIYFSLNGKKYMLLPDPNTDILDDGWLLICQSDNDHLLAQGTTSEILDYKIDGQKLKSLWESFDEVEL